MAGAAWLHGVEQAELQALPQAAHEVASALQQEVAGAQVDAQPLPHGAEQLGATAPQPPHGAAQLGPHGAAQLGSGQQALFFALQHLVRFARQHLPASASLAKANITAARADSANSFRIML